MNNSQESFKRDLYYSSMQRWDPVRGLSQYINQVKPYHCKILESITEYKWADTINCRIRDVCIFDISTKRDSTTSLSSKPFCVEGFGYMWDALPHLPCSLHDIIGVDDGMPKNTVTSEQFGDEWDVQEGYDYTVYALVDIDAFNVVGVVPGLPTIVVAGEEFGNDYDDGDFGYSGVETTENLINVGDTCRWIVAGEHLDVFTVGYKFIVANSTRGSGLYTVKSTISDGGNTVIVTEENIPADATADGVIRHRRYTTDDPIHYWVIPGNFEYDFQPGDRVIVSHNDVGSNAYTVDYSTYDGENTTIHTVENIPKGSSVQGLLYVITPRGSVVLDVIPAAYKIEAIDPTTKTLVVDGTHSVLSSGQEIHLRDNDDTMTNGTYTILSVSYVGGKTVVVVNEPLPVLSVVGYLGEILTPNDDSNYFVVLGDVSDKFVDGQLVEIVEASSGTTNHYVIHQYLVVGTNTRLYVTERLNVIKSASDTTYGSIAFHNGGYDDIYKGLVSDDDLTFIAASVSEQFSFREIT